MKNKILLSGLVGMTCLLSGHSASARRYIPVTEPIWKETKIIGHTFHSHTFGKLEVTWTDTLTDLYANMDVNDKFWEKNVVDGVVIESPATRACKALGEQINMEANYPGKKIGVPSARDYARYFISTFDHATYVSNDSNYFWHLLENWAYLTEKGYNDATAVFKDLDRRAFWTSDAGAWGFGIDQSKDGYFFNANSPEHAQIFLAPHGTHRQEHPRIGFIDGATSARWHLKSVRCIIK